MEFALVFPIFCALMFGLIDYGWFFYQRFSLAAAVRDGLRLAVTMKQSDDYATAAQQRAVDDMASAGITLALTAFTVTTIGASPAKLMRLAGSYTFQPLVHFVPLPTGPLNYSMTMMFEQQ